ncbi:MAG: ABC transporter ATP-binding protein [Nanoarchaeota archaeon]|nr:ABC transporter ATP-binding protein [Nanoarchaeota archaeon]
MLKVKKLYKHFGGVKAVDGCSFEVEKGAIVALIGPNGAGKTTVFNLITGFIEPDKGKVLLYNKDITGMAPYRISKEGVSRTFQIIRLFPKMTVLENMMLSMQNVYENFWLSMLPLKQKKLHEAKMVNDALELLKFVDLEGKKNALAGNLSYGQQKLLEMAKALASEPELLLLDEPASGVNPTMLKKITNLLKELKKKGKTILFVEHNMDFVMKIADKVVVMDGGEEIAEGPPKKIQKNKRVLDAYLGKVIKIKRRKKK